MVETQVEEDGEDSSNEEEGLESLESRELSKQIDSHMVVLDDDQPRTSTPNSDQNAAQSIVSLDLPSTTLQLVKKPLCPWSINLFKA